MAENTSRQEMQEQIRRAVAFMAAARIGQRRPGHVYSYHEGRHVPFSGSGSNAFDYEAGAHISGSASSLFHYGVGSHISLSITGNSFSGFDHDSGNHFNGKVSGSSVQIYDYGEGSYFNYSV